MSYCQAQELFEASDKLSYSGQEEACADKGQRLCTLGELCLSRENYNSPFDQVFPPSFAVPSNFSGHGWVAYETTDGDGGNCSSEGGCNDNSWVMMGLADTNHLCNTHCEVVRLTNPDGDQCPDWGIAGISKEYVCCEDTTADAEVS